MPAYVYMVECADATYYTGWTNDIQARIAAHNAGAGARYTRGRGPVRLVYLEETTNKQLALRRERAIKKLTRVQKELLAGTYDQAPPLADAHGTPLTPGSPETASPETGNF